MKLFNYIKNRLSAEECPDEGLLKKTKILQHSSHYLSKFENWLNSDQQKNMLSLIANNSDKSAKDNAFFILNIPSVCGITYQYNAKRWEEEEFLFLFDFLAKKLQSLGYKNEAIQVENWQYPSHQEKMQRAPFTNKKEALSKVLLRLTWQDTTLQSLKICACHSQNKDNNHSIQFEKLIKEITA